MSDILHFCRFAVRLIWSFILLYFMINLLIVFFGRMLPLLIFGKEKVESKLELETEV